MTQSTLFPEWTPATKAEDYAVNTHVPTRFIVTTHAGRRKFETYHDAYYYMLTECHGAAKITATDIGYIADLGHETWKRGERTYQSAGFESFIPQTNSFLESLEADRN